jgi:hypothetical protein
MFMPGAGDGASDDIVGKGPIAMKRKEAEKPKFGEFELKNVDSLSWQARIHEDKKNGTATELNITVNRQDGRLGFSEKEKYQDITGEKTGKSAELFFTQKGKIDDIGHVDFGMKLPKVSTLEEQMQGFLKNGGVQKALAEVNEDLQKRERVKQFNRHGTPGSENYETHDWTKGED